MIPRIAFAAELAPGPALVVVRLPGRTIRSRVVLAAREAHGVVRVAFASGDILTLSERSAVAIVAPPSSRPRPRRRAG